jgi:cytochrome c-type biogenesis protein CcmH/NrfG
VRSSGRCPNLCWGNARFLGADVNNNKSTDRVAVASDDQALHFGWAAFDQRRLDEAERVARGLLSRHPKHAGAQHLLGVAVLLQKRPREAVGPLAAAVRDTVNPLLETHYALALRDVGRKDEAIDWLRRAISRKPVFAAAFHELGLIFCGMRRYDDAEAVLKHGIELAPGAAELSVELGGVYICRAEPSNAKAAFARALALVPDHVRAMHGCGTALLFEGEFERAAAQFRQVLARIPEHVRARLDLAHCLLELGCFEAGVAELRIVVRSSPQRYGAALKMLASSRQGRLWLRPSMAASFLQIIENVSSVATWSS